MSLSWRPRLHRCACALGWTAGILVILLAVLVALVQLLLPLLARNPAWVAAQLGQRLQRPVGIASMEGHWSPSGPLFVMHGVTVGKPAGEAGTALELPQAELKFDLGSWLRPSRHLLNLHVRGLQLDLRRDADGWHVNGMGITGDGERQSLPPERMSVDLWLDDVGVAVTDTVLDRHYALQSRQLRLSYQGNQVRFGGVLRREGVSAALRTAGSFGADGRHGRIWVGINAADLAALLRDIDMRGHAVDHGRGEMQAWFDWRDGRLDQGLVRVDLDALALSTPDGRSTGIEALHGMAGVHQVDESYDIRWAGDDGGVLALELHQPDTPDFGVGVAARDLQLARLLPWLALKPGLSPALAQWLGHGKPHGELRRVALHWNRADGLQAVNVAFAGLGIDPVGGMPGLDHLQGELRGDAGALSLELPAQASTLQFPHAFRQPFVMSKLAGTLAFWPQDGDWHIGTDGLDFVGAGYAGQARGEVILPAQGRPFMDLYASLDHADVPAAKLFWPIDSMSPGTVAWLDRALVAGQVDQAQVLVRGNLGDWPFRHNEGRFEGRAVLSGLTLDYGRNWPRGEGIAAVASFVNNGMLVEADAGQSLGVKVGRAVALIPDFHDSLLDLNVQGSGSGASLMEFARKSPVASRQADVLAKLGLGGSGTFDFHMALPLKDTSQVRLDGVAQLEEADLSAPEWNLELGKLTGPLHFDAHGLRADALKATFRGQPSTLRLAIAGANRDPDTVLSAHLRGAYRIDELVQDYPSLDWIGQLADGRSDFDIGFTLAHRPDSDELSQTLRVESPMNGIALDLPAPLDKPAPASLPLKLELGLPIDGADLRLGLGEVMRGHLRLADGEQQPLAGSLAFGKRMPQNLPARDLRILGHASRLDVTGWVQWVAGGSGNGGPGLAGLDVSTDQAEWFGQSLGALELRAASQPGALSVDVSGPAMEGNFSVPTDELDRRGVTARLQRMYWPKASSAPAADHPATPVADAVPAVDPADTGVNPAALPPFHLWVGDLRLGEARLGEARLETWPTAEGMHIEQLRTLSSSVQINASGDWNGNARNSHTQMKISFAAEDLGAMLGAFGFDGLVEGGRTHDQLDARWPGSPSALSLATMDGTLGITVNNGRIPEAASPGVGRLLGLVSLAELPRRLTLDFGDVFGKGLAFDSITGDFRLAGGNAVTDNLQIVGPSANISITGRTGLRARDYDQQMMVVPHVGNSLPLVGAVVGGPIGAAAGLAMQGLLGKGLNKAASARYRITGSWDKPEMTLVEKHEATTPGNDAPAALEEALPAPAGTVPPPAD